MDDKIKDLLDRIRSSAANLTETAAPTARYMGQRAADGCSKAQHPDL